MSSHDYLKAAIQEIEVKLKKEGTQLPKMTKVPMSTSYRPELDSTEDAADSVELLESECSSTIFPGKLKLGKVTFRYSHNIVEKYYGSLTFQLNNMKIPCAVSRS